MICAERRKAFLLGDLELDVRVGFYSWVLELVAEAILKVVFDLGSGVGFTIGFQG